MLNIYLMFIFFNLVMFIIIMIPSNLVSLHPLILSLMLTFYVVIMSLLMNLINNNYWYSYILFLIMIGGLMILFMYFTSIASNNLININMNYLKYLVLKLILMTFFFYLNNFINMKKIYLYDYLEISFFKDCLFTLSDLSAKNLYMDFSMDLNMFMILYLFLTMVSCVLICMKIMMPFRQMNYD